MAFGSPSFCSLWFATAIVRWPYPFTKGLAEAAICVRLVRKNKAGRTERPPLL
jgi:hypothetical protein